MPPKKRNDPFNAIRIPPLVVSSGDVLVLLERIDKIDERWKISHSDQRSYLIEVALLGWLRSLGFSVAVGAAFEVIEEEAARFRKALSDETKSS